MSSDVQFRPHIFSYGQELICKRGRAGGNQGNLFREQLKAMLFENILSKKYFIQKEKNHKNIFKCRNGTACLKLRQKKRCEI